MSIASDVAQQAVSSTASQTAGTSSGNNPLASLTSNFGDFLIQRSIDADERT